MKTARADTKQKLEALVVRLTEAQRLPKQKLKLAEAGEAAPAAPAAAQPTAQTQQAPAGKPAAPSPSLGDQAPTEDAVTVESVIGQLNTIRGGKSFKDDLVKQELTRYFDGLDESEKDALHAYLKGLAQIVSGQIDAGAAEEPKDHGVQTATTGTRSRTIKPNVVKKAPKPAATPVSAAGSLPTKEDTTPPAPIVPKKR